MIRPERKPARFSKKAWEQFWRGKDFATPKQRRLLDRLEKVRCDMAPLKLIESVPDGDRQQVFTVRPGGCYWLTWGWIKREIRKRQRELRKERRQEIEAAIGAGI
jgi:hypothetical protein